MMLEHVNFTVSDLDRSVGFYRELLDLDVRWKGKTSDGRDAAHVGDDRHYLAIFQSAGPGRAENDYATVGINHFGFVVDSLDAAKKRLASMGVRIKAEMDYEPGRRLYFFDPDGIEVELVEYDA